nr:SNF2-related protein [Streptomyces rhizosphaericus]
MGATRWSTVLKATVSAGDGPAAALAAVVTRQAQTGQLSLKDQRLVLLASGDHPGWQVVREAVWTHLAGHAESARDVLALHVQMEIWPPVAFDDIRTRDTEGCGEFAVRARVGLPGYEVNGPVRRGSSKKRAREQAAVSLLALMASVSDPLACAPAAAPAPRAEYRGRPGLGVEAFQALLERRIAESEPGTCLAREVLERGVRRQLRGRDLDRLLFETAGAGWEDLRRVALDAAARVPGTAAAILGRRAEKLSLPGLTYEREVHDGDGARTYTVTAVFNGGREVTRGAPGVGRGRKTARHRAAVSALASLCGLPEPDEPEAEPQPLTVKAGQDSLQLVNQLAMQGHISKPVWAYQTTGPSHGPVFVCTVHCEHEGHGLEATGEGQSKSQARRRAADALLPRLRNTASSADPGPVPPAQPPGEVREPAPAESADPAPAGSPAAEEVVTEALRAGCALVLADREEHPDQAALLVYRADGRPMPSAPLPPPLAETARELALEPLTREAGVRRVMVVGWRVPVPVAAAVLLSLSGRPGLHPSAVAWADAARLGLEMVAAKLVYPAVTADGWDRWRVGPLRGAAGRAVADLAARLPPHAHCQVVGGTPVRMTAPQETLERFLDHVADAYVRTPGAAAAFGPGPFTSVVAQRGRELLAWADEVEERLDPASPVAWVLRVHAPEGDDARAGRLRASLLLTQPPAQDGAVGREAAAEEVWAGRAAWAGVDHRSRSRTRRALRRAAAVWPALDRLAGQDQPTSLEVSAQEASGLLGGAAARLQHFGLTVRWPRELTGSLTTHTVLGARTASGRQPGAGLTLDELTDFRWQLALDGEALTDEEMDALAEASRPLVRLRDRWVLVDPRTAFRAGHRQMAPLTGIDVLQTALTGTITVDGEDYACQTADGLTGVISTLRAGTANPAVPVPEGLAARLRNYQHQALTWMARTTALGVGVCLADDMGLGKTITLIALHLHRQLCPATAGPTLVVCPASLLSNWQREIHTFAPGALIRRYHGSTRSLDSLANGEFVLTTYGTMRYDAAQLATAGPWGMVVADEAQHVKNPDAKTTRALRTLPAGTRIALTGTPVENSLTDLWTLLDWTIPGLLGPLTSFRARYARAVEDNRDPAAAERLARLVRPFLLRRRKSDPGIVPELPRKTETDRPVALSREQAALYEAVVRETLSQIQASSGIARRGLVVKLLTALKQICNHPAQYLKETGNPQTAGRSGKLELLEELLGSITAEGDAALVFTQYVEMARLLEKHLSTRGIDSQFLHGGTPVPQRQALVDAFQAGKVPVFLLSLKAAGTGLNLTRAGHVVHYDRWWNPAVEAQATDRAYRIGQTRPVQVHRLIAEGTLEDRIASLLAAKKELAEAVLQGGEAALTELSDTELAELVTLR